MGSIHPSRLPKEFPITLDMTPSASHRLERGVRVLPGEWQGLGISTALCRRMQEDRNGLVLLTPMEFCAVFNAAHKTYLRGFHLQEPNRLFFEGLVARLNSLVSAGV